MEQLAEASAGGTAGLVATTVIYPLVLAKTRLQAQRNKNEKSQESYNGPIDCLIKNFRQEGFLGLFKGLRSSLPKAFATNFIFYFVHSVLKPFFKSKTFINKMLHGIFAGIIVQLVMTPVEFINTQVMVDKTGKTRFRKTFRKVIREKGIGGFYEGIKPQLLLTVNPGITNVVRSFLEPKDHGKQAAPLTDFLIGASSKAVASTITYPLVVSKIHLYTKEMDILRNSQTENSSPKLGMKNIRVSPNSKEKTGLLGTISHIVEQEGIFGLYKGLETQLGSAVLKEAFLNMTRHEINRVILAIFAKISPVEP